MIEPGRLLVLSPHPDDAVWSCGGFLAACRSRGRPVVVVTVFDGDPPDDVLAAARVPGQEWRLMALPRLRRRENERAMERLGVDHVGLGEVDAALRRKDGAFAFPQVRHLFDPAVKVDADVEGRVARALAALVRPRDQIVVPAAVGGHIDHRAACGAVRRAGFEPDGLYAEFPYLLCQDGAASPLAWAEGLAPDRDAWVEAACCYRSQVLAIFGGSDRFRADLGRHMALVEAATSSATARA